MNAYNTKKRQQRFMGLASYLLIFHVRALIQILVAHLAEHFSEDLARMVPDEFRIIPSLGFASLGLQRENGSYFSEWSKIGITITNVISYIKSAIIDSNDGLTPQTKLHSVH